MANTITPRQPDAATEQAFDLDPSLVEVVDRAGAENITDDGCGATCGACTTGVA